MNCDDDNETFTNMVDGEVSLSMEPTKPIFPTPVAFNAVDTGKKNIPNIHTANDDDGPRSNGDEHKSDRNTRFKNGTYRGMLSGDVLRDYPKQVVPPTKAGNASTDVCECLSWTQKYLWRWCNDSCFSAQKETTRARVGKNGPLARIRKKHLVRTKPKDSWHSSKTALFIATGSRFPSLTTYEGDIRRRS